MCPYLAAFYHIFFYHNDALIIQDCRILMYCSAVQSRRYNCGYNESIGNAHSPVWLHK